MSNQDLDRTLLQAIFDANTNRNQHRYRDAAIGYTNIVREMKKQNNELDSIYYRYRTIEAYYQDNNYIGVAKILYSFSIDNLKFACKLLTKELETNDDPKFKLQVLEQLSILMNIIDPGNLLKIKIGIEQIIEEILEKEDKSINNFYSLESYFTKAISITEELIINEMTDMQEKCENYKKCLSDLYVEKSNNGIERDEIDCHIIMVEYYKKSIKLIKFSNQLVKLRKKDLMNSLKLCQKLLQDSSNVESRNMDFSFIDLSNLTLITDIDDFHNQLCEKIEECI